MPKFVYQPQEKKYDVPEGDYRCRFLRTRDRPPFEGPSKYKTASTEPRLEWEFEVVEGPLAGKLIGYTTGSNPASPRSGCFQMLKWFLGRTPGDLEPIDSDTFIGRLFDIEWRVNPQSDTGNMHIAHMKAVQGQAAPAVRPAGLHTPAPTSGPAPAAATPPAQQRKGPPPRKAEPPARSFWVEHPEPSEPRAMDEHALARYIEAEKLNPAHVKCALDGDGEYKTAADFGFKDLIPF